MYLKPIFICTLDINTAQFIKGSSPPVDEDPSLVEPEVPTEIDSDDQVPTGKKRAAKTTPPNPR